VLHFLEQWGNPKPGKMPLEHAVTLANQLLMTAAEYDTATGGVDPTRGDFATVKLLSASGVRAIPVDEQTVYWEQKANR
jgi:proteasome beta subunit